MPTLTRSFIGFVAFQHLLFLVVEMFLWQSEAVMTRFGTTPEFAKASAVLAMNQGLYNGFLAAGLVFGLLYPAALPALHIKTFFLACVIVAGLYGAWSVSRKILFVQAAPAVIALALTQLSA